jgi:hypothetical protein
MGWLAKEPELIPNPERGKRFVYSPKHADQLLEPPILTNGKNGLCHTDKAAKGMKLTSHLLMLRLTLPCVVKYQAFTHTAVNSSPKISFIQYFLSDDRSKASSKIVPPKVRSRASPFK